MSVSPWSTDSDLRAKHSLLANFLLNFDIGAPYNINIIPKKPFVKDFFKKKIKTACNCMETKEKKILWSAI